MLEQLHDVAVWLWIITRGIGFGYAFWLWKREKKRFYLYLSLSSEASMLAALARRSWWVHHPAAQLVNVLLLPTSGILGIVALVKLARHVRNRTITIATVRNGNVVAVIPFVDEDDAVDTPRSPQ